MEDPTSVEILYEVQDTKTGRQITGQIISTENNTITLFNNENKNSFRIPYDDLISGRFRFINTQNRFDYSQMLLGAILQDLTQYAPIAENYALGKSQGVKHDQDVATIDNRKVVQYNNDRDPRDPTRDYGHTYDYKRPKKYIHDDGSIYEDHSGGKKTRRRRRRRSKRRSTKRSKRR
jgi:hypothetical protein